MKKILILFFFICTSIAFAKYEDVYNVKIEKKENNVSYKMNTNSSYSECEYGVSYAPSKEKAKEVFEQIPTFFSKYSMEKNKKNLDVIEHKTFSNSGVFIFSTLDGVDKKSTYYLVVFWAKAEIRMFGFTKASEAEKFLKYLDINDLFSSSAEELYIKSTILKAKY